MKSEKTPSDLAHDVRQAAARLAWTGEKRDSDLPPERLAALRLIAFGAHVLEGNCHPDELAKLNSMHAIWEGEAPQEVRHVRGANLVRRCAANLADITAPELRQQHVTWLVSELWALVDRAFKKLDDDLPWMVGLFESRKRSPAAIFAELCLRAHALGHSPKRSVEHVRKTIESAIKNHPELYGT